MVELTELDRATRFGMIHVRACAALTGYESLVARGRLFTLGWFLRIPEVIGWLNLTSGMLLPFSLTGTRLNSEPAEEQWVEAEAFSSVHDLVHHAILSQPASW